MSKDFARKHFISTPDYTHKSLLHNAFSIFKSAGLKFHWLSLDVAMGAMICNVMVLQLLRVSPIPWLQVLILGATVWLIYISDHLWDVKTITRKPLASRRLFFKRNFDKLRVFAYLLTGFILGISFLFLPSKIIEFGVLLGTLVILYLWIVHYLKKKKFYRFLPKEVMVCTMYLLGIWGSAGILSVNFGLVHWLLAIMFGQIAMQNLIIFSLYELEEDTSNNQDSFVQVLGKKATKVTVHSMSLVIFVLGIYILIISSEVLVLNWVIIQWVMTFVLSCLALWPTRFKTRSAYRFIGDGVFFLPLFMWV